MKDRKLATRYARALLGALGDPTEAAEVDRFLTDIATAMREQEAFRALLLDPAEPRERRKAVLVSLAEGSGMSRRVSSFITAVVDHNRLAALPAIAEVFHEERERAQGIVVAEITTASPLDRDLLDRAHRTLEQLTGGKVRLTAAVEPELLGGAVTRVGSMVYDGSLRTQIDRLRRRMAQE